MFAKFDDLRLIVAYVLFVNMYYIYTFKCMYTVMYTYCLVLNTDGLKHKEVYT